MAIDRAFTLPGIGLVVTGTVGAGTVAVGDRLTLAPRGVAVRVRGLHAHNHGIASAAAGERCAINIAGSIRDGGEPRRGDWLTAPERHLPVRRVDLMLRPSRHAEMRLKDGLLVHLHLGTEDVVGRAAVLSGRSLAAGENGFVQVELDQPIAALAGDRVVLRDHAARATLAGGRVVDPLPPRRGRRAPARIALLAAMAPADPMTALRQMLAVAGVVDLVKFALIRNLAPGQMAALAEAVAEEVRVVGPQGATVAVTPGHLAAMADEIAAALARWHQTQPDMLGPTRPALLVQVRGTQPAAFDAALAELAAQGRAVREGGMWRLSQHRPRLANADEKLWARMRPLLTAGELRPPRVREIAEELALEPEGVERLLHRAERLGRVAKVAPNRFFLPETMDRLARIAGELAAAAPESGFTAAMFNECTGVGRNLTIQILEYLDKIGATRRIGETRILIDAGEALG